MRAIFLLICAKSTLRLGKTIRSAQAIDGSDGLDGSRHARQGSRLQPKYLPNLRAI